MAGPRDTVALSEDLVQSWLEWAGQKMLAMPIASPAPKSPRAAWPNFPDDPNTAYGYSGIGLRPPAPSKDEIPIVDEILTLPLIIPNEIQRRIIQARLLVRPLSGRYLYTWSRIAKMLHVDRRAVIRWHRIGLSEIVKLAEKDKVCRISLALSQLAQSQFSA